MTSPSVPKPEIGGETAASVASVLPRGTDKYATPVGKQPTMYTSVSHRMASTYKKVGVESRVESASPHELIALLFDGLLTTLSAARLHMAAGNIPAKSQAITKATRIITEGLKGSLDPKGGDLTDNLSMLYDYCVTSLMQAHLKNDVTMIDEVIGLIGPLSETWKSMNTNNNL
jgi:flagellar protein FliS